MKEALGIETDLIRGDNGVFDVVVDGERIYSKHETGRFPENAEIVRAIEARD